MNYTAPKQLGEILLVADMAAGGVVALPAGKRVELYRNLVFSQTSPGQSVTLPDPSDTTITFSLDVTAGGSTAITVQGFLLPARTTMRVTWDGNGWRISPILHVANVDPTSANNDSEFYAANHSEWFNSATGVLWRYLGELTPGVGRWWKQNAVTTGTDTWSAGNYILNAGGVAVSKNMTLEVSNGTSVGDVGVTGLEHPGTAIITFDIKDPGTIINGVDSSITLVGAETDFSNVDIDTVGKRASLHLWRSGTDNLGVLHLF